MLPRLPVIALLALAPLTARAEVGEHDFSPLHLQQLVGLEDFTFDTDWFPMDAPLQLRLVAHAGNSVEISMPGVAEYDWDAGAIGFTGEPGAGTFDVDIGLTLDAKIRFDVFGQQWESDIIGPYDYAVIAGSTYTPYLLHGNPERPVTIDDQTDPVTFVSVPVTPDIIIASGNLDIDAYVIVHAVLGGTQIEAATLVPEQQMAVVTVEGESKPLSAGPGPLPDPFNAEGTLVCTFNTAPTIVLKPTLVMTILGQDFEVANIEIPIALPPFDDTIRFDPLHLAFDRPAPPPPPPPPATTGDSDSDGDSDSGPTTSDSADDSADPDPSTPTSSAESTTDAASDESSDTAGIGDDEGCGCRSTAPAPLALLPLLLARRRRRR